MQTTTTKATRCECCRRVIQSITVEFCAFSFGRENVYRVASRSANGRVCCSLCSHGYFSSPSDVTAVARSVAAKHGVEFDGRCDRVGFGVRS